jgi:hypothetical protein
MIPLVVWVFPRWENALFHYNMFSRVEPLLYHRKPYLSSCYYVLYVRYGKRFIQLCNKVLWSWNKANPVLVRVVGEFWGNVLIFC